jgi:PAS domain S-box-containing protein
VERGEHEEQNLRRSALPRKAGAVPPAQQRAQADLLRAKEALVARTRELAHALSLTRATLESTADALLVTDLEGRVLAFNQKFLSVWGLPAQVVEGGSHQEIVRSIRDRFSEPTRSWRRSSRPTPRNRPRRWTRSSSRTGACSSVSRARTTSMARPSDGCGATVT